ncbi:diadenylate cyclase [Paludibaculum fermentans]|uniref:DNA integrity scanning protein DisA nucleotide-binding domain protein n=1 Tax=Paludibaculum fermentans TaxID=1473598 RepID=A0A7S7SL03_PALFE|nr:diadenylate cyclase [Paludibaculum fermentans]QOY88884.1 DNA integrity scanning protein DisA nucleotide-binding domain protein [Paludibaculum fermentans]
MHRWQPMADLAILAVVIYLFLRWTAENRLRVMLLAISAMFGLSALASRMDLPLAAWVLEAFGFTAVLFLVTIFQPELRHLVMRTEGWFRRPSSRDDPADACRAVTEAVFALAREKTGALLIVVRQHSIRELAGGGVEIGATPSSALLQAVFQKSSPIHDGGVVIELDRITRAGVLLPLTQRTDLPAQFGTRHRAALGISERCDAKVVVVSEERGDVTLVHRASWRHAAVERELVDFLSQGGQPEAAGPGPSVRRLLFGHMKQKLAALSMTALVWALTLVSSGTAIKDLQVPVEFTNPPAGMDVSKPSATQLEMRVRGPRWAVEALRPDQMTVRFDLSRGGLGGTRLAHPSDVVNLPPAVSVEWLRPDEITVNLVPARRARMN